MPGATPALRARVLVRSLVTSCSLVWFGRRGLPWRRRLCSSLRTMVPPVLALPLPLPSIVLATLAAMVPLALALPLALMSQVLATTPAMVPMALALHLALLSTELA